MSPPGWCRCVVACLDQAGDETVSRFRPLALRRFRTSRPFFVLMRTRKPCVRRRRRRFGWNVRFMIADPLSPEASGGETLIVAKRPWKCQSLGRRGALPRKTEADCQRSKRVLKSRPLRLPRRVSPRSFPQLWKKMWKSQRFRPSARPSAWLVRASTQRRWKTGRKYDDLMAGVHVKRR